MERNLGPRERKGASMEERKSSKGVLNKQTINIFNYPLFLIFIPEVLYMRK
jgi:hypothetical protein